MMSAQPEEAISSPSLVELAVQVRTLLRLSKTDKVILKAADVARVYHANKEKLNLDELGVLCEVLREFGIVPAHMPPDFLVHVANVTKFCEVKDSQTVSASHVAAIIFTRMQP